MARLLDESGDAGSNVVNGDGTRSATYTLAEAQAQYVESVVAQITNASAVDVRPTVTVRDRDGQVIAKQQQDDAIPAGDTGTATFALRLAGNGGASSLQHPIGFYTAEPASGISFAAGVAIPDLTLAFGGAHAGVDLLDLTTVGAKWPTVKAAGLYYIMARIGFDPDPVAPFPAGTNGSLDLSITNELPPADFWSQQATDVFVCDNSSAGANIHTIAWARYFNPAPQGGPFGPVQFFTVHVARPIGLAVTNVSGFVSVQRIY